MKEELQGMATVAKFAIVQNEESSSHNAQYRPIAIDAFQNAHDRFLCIDDTVYHIGASLKDLGKKWFAFSRMEIGTEALQGKM